MPIAAISALFWRVLGWDGTVRAPAPEEDAGRMCQANICASNANRLIDNFTELFGNQSISGFAMLAAYDLNADGLMDGIIGSEANDNAPSRAAA